MIGYYNAGLWMNGTTECIQRITGCDYGDVYCAERYAFAALVKGPFHSTLSAKEESRITGIPNHIRHALLTLPRAYAPKLDLAVHLRVQLQSFEHQLRHDDPEYVKEVNDWLNSTTGTDVFRDMEARIVEELTNMKLYNVSNDVAYIYVAADDETIKDKFIERIESGHPIKVMRIETRGIVHTKNLHNLRNITHGEGQFDMVFDWYALSMAQVVLGWRVGYTSMRSTFVSAARTLGGANGWVLAKNRRGEPSWMPM